MSQKVYLAYCARECIAPRQKLVKGLTETTLDARNFILAPEDIMAVAYALTVCCLSLFGKLFGKLLT